MHIIRIPEKNWGKVWRTLVKSGPISQINLEEIYIISDKQLRLLKKKKLPFEVVPDPNGRMAHKNHGYITESPLRVH